MARVSGQALGADQGAQLFAPLGMTSTFPYDGISPLPVGAATSDVILPTLRSKPAIWPWQADGPGRVEARSWA